MALTGLTAVTVSAPLDIELGVTLELDALDDDEIESVTLEHGEATVRGARRTTLYAQWWRPCGPPRGVVAIVHGLKDHSARYGAFAERLVGRGFAVHAFDLRGHARSEGPRAWVDSFDDYAQILSYPMPPLELVAKGDGALAEELAGPVHAFSLAALTPSEAQKP